MKHPNFLSLFVLFAIAAVVGCKYIDPNYIGGVVNQPDVTESQDGFVQIGNMFFSENVCRPPSGLSNGDTWTVKTREVPREIDRSSDGKLKVSPDPRECAALEAAGRKDSEFEMSYWNPEAKTEYLPRGQVVGQDDEVDGRVKWNYRRSTGADDLPAGTVFALVERGAAMDADGRVECRRHLQLDQPVGSGDPQRSDVCQESGD